MSSTNDSRPKTRYHSPARPIQLGLVGNPNTGKSTLFNTLTGLRQHVGNYPGVTVTTKTGIVFLDKTPAYITDLPGTYSLSASSPDERIVFEFLSGRIENAPSPDLIVCVVDATNLSRNLFLASQIAEREMPMVIALSFWDSALRQKTRIDVSLLSKRLGVPVIPVNAASGEGIAELKQAILASLENKTSMVRISWPEPVHEAILELRRRLEKQGLPMGESGAQRVLFDSVPQGLDPLVGKRPEVRSAVVASRQILKRAGFHPHSVESISHFKHISGLLDGIIQSEGPRMRSGESVDRILTHRFWGLGVFVLFMYLVFQSVYSWSEPFMQWIDSGKSWLQGWCSGLLGAYPQLQSLVSDGVIEGVGAVLIFLPQILTLFLFIALLEETGYMARAAFLMDRIFAWSGLNGKSFVPLLSSFACAVPGILSTRTIEDRRSRLITIFIAPLMSCSARLPVYVLVIGALIEPAYGPAIAGLTLFGMHFLGLLIALPTAWILSKSMRGHKPKPFVLELPDYQAPKIKNVLIRMWSEGREFLIRAGTLIFSITLIVWALLYYPRPESLAESVKTRFAQTLVQGQATMSTEETFPITDRALDEAALEREIARAYVEQSYLSRLGKTIQPIFDPAGFDWKITLGVLASFPAREVIVSTLGVIYSLGGEVDEESPSLRDAIRNSKWTEGPRAGQPVFTLAVGLAIMVFFALCQQCGSTLAVIRSEANTKWAVASFVYMTTLAWICAVITYQSVSWLTSL